VDNVKVPHALLSLTRPTNPGSHVITAARSGKSVTETLTLAEGEKKTVNLHVPAAETAVAQTAASPIQAATGGPLAASPANTSAHANANSAPTTSNEEATSASPEEKTAPKASHVSLAALVGYGFNDLKIGLGVRGGYTTNQNIYIGGAFVYHMGFYESYLSQMAWYHLHSTIYYMGVETGYDVPLGPITLRPYLAIGYARASQANDGTYVHSFGASKLAAWSGATALCSLGAVFIGGDIRYFLASDTQVFDANAVGVFATSGVPF
jgi:hypothetical protein